MYRSALRSKPIIIMIVGKSGSGKTTMANTLAEYGIPTVVSYTTRPMRPGEKNGVEHIFVSPEEKPDESEMLAYTKFGDYEYWSTRNQVHKMTTYVIDEKGISFFKKKYSNDYILFTILVKRDNEDILKSGVDTERMNRDNDREEIPESEYDYIINNNYTLLDFKTRLKLLANDLKSIL